MDFDIVSDRPSEGVFVIALSGEVDLYTAPEFKQQLIDAVAEGAKHVVVDLSLSCGRPTRAVRVEPALRARKEAARWTST